MSERGFRRRQTPANRRAASSTRTSPPEPRRKINPELGRSLRERPSEHADHVLHNSKSEPFLQCAAAEEAAAAVEEEEEEENGVLYRRQTCTDIFLPPAQVYKKDAKVVVNVTVEGSPGPVRTMVRLGSDVEETIKLVMKKYNEEGRTPPLHPAKFQLHHSYFSLHSLGKSDLIGDVGSRSFYLRKQSSSSSDEIRATDVTTTSFLPCFMNITTFIQKFCKIFGCIP